ncbi:hypothetical protein BD309DRAFT_972573, partial [Dichomitus squalens]
MPLDSQSPSSNCRSQQSMTYGSAPQCGCGCRGRTKRWLLLVHLPPHTPYL